MSFWLTVPHAKCPPMRGGHLCDYAAPKMAHKLASELGESQVLEGDLSRDKCDLNREECKLTTAYRIGLTGKLEREGKPSLLLDVHSYPTGAEDFGAYDMVILDDADSPTSSSYGEFLAERLRSQGINVGQIRGARNSIQEEMHSRGVNAMLLEFREGLGDAQEEKITRLTAQATRDWLAQ